MSILIVSVSTSILILFIVVIRSVLQSKLPPKTFTILWGVVLFRLLIPITISSQFSIFTLIRKAIYSLPLQRLDALSDVMSLPISETTMMNEISQTTISTLLMLWLTGMVVASLFIIITHLRCRHIYKMAIPIENTFITKWKKEHPTKRTIQIKQSDKITTPLTYGIVHPIILLPKVMDYTDENKASYILTHELTHIKRFDVLLKYLLAASLCVHWFNPLVWVMYILANRDIEISCDKAVVKTFGERTKSAYALTLISLEETKCRLNPLCNNFSKNAIEERVTSIMKIKKTSLVGVAFALVLIAGATMVFATSAAPMSQYETLKYMGINVDNLSSNKVDESKMEILDLDSIPDNHTVTIIYGTGEETVLKQATQPKYDSILIYRSITLICIQLVSVLIFAGFTFCMQKLKVRKNRR